MAGLLPVANGLVSDEMAVALRERQDLIETRAIALAEAAVENGEPWLRQLGEPPAETGAREAWLAEVRTVAAYRDRYGVDAQTALGGEARTDAQKLDQARARQAIWEVRNADRDVSSHTMGSAEAIGDFQNG